MLARIAESCYWIGRHIERCEHSSRYMKTQYFSTLNAPMSQNKDFALRSILFMSGGSFQIQGDLQENTVWQKVIFDPNNADSLLSLVKNIRESARGIRNVLSEEFWEAINKWYLDTQNLEAQNFSSDGFFPLIEKMNDHIVSIKWSLHHTFLRDDVWNFISLGIYMERAVQVLRIIRSKISDSIILSNNGENQALLQYQWTTLLMSLEAFSIHNKKNMGVRSRKSIFEILLGHGGFPRSLQYTALKINRHLNGISVHPPGHQQVKMDFERLMNDCLDFDDFSDQDKVINLIDKAYNCISDFHFEIEQLYFK